MTAKLTISDRNHIKDLWTKTTVAAEEYVNAVINKRKEQWRFIAYVYLFNKALQAHGKKSWTLSVEEKIGRKLTKPEIERPYLALLHLALGKHIEELRIKCSKMASALEMIEKYFKGKKPDAIKIIRFIEQNHGIEGLYSEYRNVSSSSEKCMKRSGDSVTEVKPILIDNTSFYITNAGGVYKMRLPEVDAGKYMISVEVDKNGFITQMEPLVNNRKVA